MTLFQPFSEAFSHNFQKYIDVNNISLIEGFLVHLIISMVHADVISLREREPGTNSDHVGGVRSSGLIDGV